MESSPCNTQVPHPSLAPKHQTLESSLTAIYQIARKTKGLSCAAMLSLQTSTAITQDIVTVEQFRFMSCRNVCNGTRPSSVQPTNRTDLRRSCSRTARTRPAQRTETFPCSMVDASHTTVGPRHPERSLDDGCRKEKVYKFAIPKILQLSRGTSLMTFCKFHSAIGLSLCHTHDS